MADVITRFQLETTQYDSKLRDEAKRLSDFARTASMAGNEFQKFTKDNVEAAKAFGNIGTSATNAKDKVKELVGAYNQMANAYNVLTKEQQQSDWAKAMADSMNVLKDRIKDAKQELYGFDEQLKNVGKGGLFSGFDFGNALSVFGGNLMTKGASMLTGMASEIGDMVQQGIQLAQAGEGVRNAFERLNQPGLLDNLKEATHGTVSELELMKAAVKFDDFKLPVEELGTMLAFAQQKAKDTGQSVDYMVDSIVTGLGRKSLMILDNLGLSAAEIKEKMAQTGDMTKAVGEIIREQMSRAGDYVETAADRASRAAADAQNQMEELGRTALPVSQQWAQAMASIKSVILDVLNNAVIPLINKLTIAGQMKDAMNNRGSNDRVSRQISWLQNPGDEGKQSVYNRIESDYVDQINHARSEYNKLRKDAVWNPFAAWKADKALGELNAIKQEWNDFKAQAKPIMNPVTTKVTVDTKDAERDVNSLKQKLAGLQAERRAAIKAGDTEKSKDLLKQINQTKADIKGLDPTAFKTGGGSGTNPVKQAADRVASAQHDYRQAIEQARMSLENGTKNEADYKKQLLSAEERLWNALGDAYNIHKDQKYKQAQDECAVKIKQLGREVTASIEAQKKAQEAARQLEHAQRKLAEAQKAMSDAQKSGDLKGYYKAQEQMQTAQATVDRIQAENPTLSKSKEQTVRYIMEVNDDQLKKLRELAIDDKTIKVNVEQGKVDLPDVQDKTYTVTIDADTAEAQSKVDAAVTGWNAEKVTIPITIQTAPEIGKAVWDTLPQQVQQQVRNIAVSVPMKFDLTQDNIAAFIGNLDDQIKNAPFGSTLFQNLTAQMADATTLKSLMEVAMQNGIDMAEFDPQQFWQKIFGENPGDYISDETWQNLIDKFNEELKKAGKKPISIDFATGKSKGEKSGKEEKSAIEVGDKLVGGIKSMVSNLENIGIEIPQGFKDVVSGMDSVLGILNSIQVIVSAINSVNAISGLFGAGKAAAGAATGGAAGGGGLLSNLFGKLFGFANGGVVHAANGFAGVVPGNYGYDAVPALLTSGEVVLNRAQVGNLASQIEGGGLGALEITGILRGEDIALAIDNRSRRTGRGEYVTTNRR